MSCCAVIDLTPGQGELLQAAINLRVPVLALSLSKVHIEQLEEMMTKYCLRKFTEDGPTLFREEATKYLTLAGTLMTDALDATQAQETDPNDKKTKKSDKRRKKKKVESEEESDEHEADASEEGKKNIKRKESQEGRISQAKTQEEKGVLEQFGGSVAVVKTSCLG